MEQVSVLRGVKDVILDEAEKFHYIISAIQKIAQNFGFRISYFPIIENSHTYIRTLGESSDIVTKEMYNFIDKGENNITLRPEFTAGVVRSLITNNLFDKLPLKFFSYGPLFRYERPQKGRQRQFYQINFEYFGNATYYAEVEIILLINNIIRHFELSDKIQLEINSIGSINTRTLYKEALVNYLAQYKNDLSPDSKRRLENNPLRILDSKDSKDQEILYSAPQISEFYDKEDQEFFDNILSLLTELSISYKVNSKLVRGLDYYTKTVFEFTTSLLGAQNAVFAGGRYDNLVKNMGGKDTPAIGFAGGLERLQALINNSLIVNIDVVVINVTAQEKDYAFRIMNQLRDSNIIAEAILTDSNLGKKMKKAGKYNTNLVVIIGDDEYKNQTVKIKDFRNGKEITTNKGDMVTYIKEIL
mgnify:CR=1 FL=1